MDRKLYKACMNVIESYVKLEGYSIRVISTQEPKIACSRCGKELEIEKSGFVLNLSDRVLVFYCAVCPFCRIVHLHKRVELEG